MSGGGARTVGDLVDGGADRLVIGCDKCDRAGSYALAGVVIDHGPLCRLPDLLAYLSRNCPKRVGRGLDRCGAVFRFDVE